MKAIKRNILVISAAMLIISTIIIFKTLKTEGTINSGNASETIETQENRSNLYSKYSRLKKSNKVGLIVISYEGQCCERTRIFLEKYNKDALALINKYQNKIETLYINVANLGLEDKAALSKIANENGALRLPSMLFLKKTEHLKI